MRRLMENFLNDNFDVIGHVGVAAMLLKWKNFGPLYLLNRTMEKIEIWHLATTLHGEYELFDYDVIDEVVSQSKFDT